MHHPYTIALKGGKYMIQNDSGLLSFWRHGEAWPAADDLKHAGVVLAMAQRIEELEVAIKEALDGTLQTDGIRYPDGIAAVAQIGVIATRGMLVSWETGLRHVLEQK